jgi:type II secretory pathway component PulC
MPLTISPTISSRTNPPPPTPAQSTQPGSLFEDIGIQDGDVITEVNGIVISSPQDSAALLRELTQSDQFDVEVLGADGAPRTLSYVIQP